LATRAAAARHFTTALYVFNPIISNENYLTAWAFVEAAHFAIQFNSKIKKFLSEKEGQDQGCCGHQSGGAQAVPGLLLHHEGIESPLI
jgi:hypothetical protein